ncbi:MAG: type 4a pilus biogenesis protein PilO [Methylovulum sp.]|nr:type 4a pilus biogenesis protein PilO [Methylovulum sp.]
MNLSEINWDYNASGTWPFAVKAAVVAMASVLVGGAWVYLDTFDQMAELEKAQNQEQQLKTEFEAKQKKAINLQDYQEQLNQIEADLYQMIRQMPTKEEVASLLTDISQMGLTNGLEFKLFKPGPSIRKDFYSELPISIEVTGKYDELGLFISGLATLPRIVTVHDVTLIPKESKDKEVVKPGDMTMTATIKTYNESAENVPSVNAAGNKNKRGKK